MITTGLHDPKTSSNLYPSHWRASRQSSSMRSALTLAVPPSFMSAVGSTNSQCFYGERAMCRVAGHDATNLFMNLE